MKYVCDDCLKNFDKPSITPVDHAYPGEVLCSHCGSLEFTEIKEMAVNE